MKKIYSLVILIVVLLNACSSPVQTPAAISSIAVLPTSTDVPPTAVPPTAIPPTVAPPTAVPPLFFDDFSDKQATIDAGWYLEKRNEFGWTWSPNMLKGYADKGEAWTASGPDTVGISDYAVQVQAQPTGAGYAEYGIFFRTEQLEGGNYYVFTVTTDGKYALAEFGKGNKGRDAIPFTDSEYVHTHNSANTLAVLADGDQINLYINDFQVASLTDVSITTGDFTGLFVRSSRRERAEVGFSQFTILSVEQAKADFGAAP